MDDWMVCTCTSRDDDLEWVALMDGGRGCKYTDESQTTIQAESFHCIQELIHYYYFASPPPSTRWAAHFNQTVVAPFFSPCTCTNCDHCAGFQHKGLGEDDVTMNCLLKRIIFTFFVVQNIVLLNFLRFSFTTTFYQH